jgi:hypothetical protein
LGFGKTEISHTGWEENFIWKVKLRCCASPQEGDLQKAFLELERGIMGLGGYRQPQK